MRPPLAFIDVPNTLTAHGIATMATQVATLQPGVVVVLRGTSQVFCSGMDLGLAAVQDATQLRQGLQAYADLLLTLRTTPHVVIAAMEGSAYGGGVGLAAACDLVIASNEVRLGLPEALHGFYPAIVFAVLGERLTPHKARQLALTCESIDALEAHSLGLVDIVGKPTDFATALQRQARKLQRAVPAAVLGIKRHAPHTAALRSALEHGTEATLASLLAPGVAQALAQEVAS